jgi:hypothetical protein
VLHLDGDLEDMDRLVVGQVKLLYQVIGKANALLKKVTKTKKNIK